MPRFGGHKADLNYEDSGTGHPVALLPGWGGSIAELAPLRDALLDGGYRVIAIDLPGSGKSGPQPRTYEPSYYQDDPPLIIALLEAVGASPAHVVGFSDGGEYALVMAANHPEAVSALVTWGSAGSLGTNVAMADMMASVIDAPAPPMAGFSEYMKATYGTENARIMTQSVAGSFRSIMEAGGDISRSQAATIHCPALLITGEHDFLATPSMVADMAHALPNGEFIEAKGASHPIHHEQPEWLIKTVVDWLSRH